MRSRILVASELLMGPSVDLRQQTAHVDRVQAVSPDLRAGLLLRGHEPIALRPKTWSVLCYLVERAGQLITKRQLLEAVWGEVAVTESVLNNSIRELRIALGDSSEVPRGEARGSRSKGQRRPVASGRGGTNHVTAA